jgi:hypothetical protein
MMPNGVNERTDMKIRCRGLRLPGLRVTVLVALLALLPAGTAAAAQRPANGVLPTIHIKASDYHYDLSRRSLPLGPAAVAFTNRGPHTHALQMVRIDADRTQAEFVTVLLGFLDGTVTDAPPWLHDAPFAFGPTSPGRSVTAAIRLSEPGRYVVFDLLTGRSGRTFAELGMVASFSVGGDPGPGSLPNADAVITGTDSMFQVPPLRAGDLILQLQNEATVERQFAIIQLQQGSTIEDLRAWIGGGQVGPTPGEFIANVLPIAAGQQLLVKLRLAPGHYLLVDNGETENGVPYSELGLLTTFVVAPADHDLDRARAPND